MPGYIERALKRFNHPAPARPEISPHPAAGIANDTVKQRRSKAIDTQYYWIRDRVHQGHITVDWKKGCENLADYYTKHHPKRHHAAIRSTYLHSKENPSRNYFELLQQVDTAATG